MKTSFKQGMLRVGTPILILLIPFAGIVLSGRFNRAYLEFPPKTSYIAHSAVLGTRELLKTFPRLTAGLDEFISFKPRISRSPRWSADSSGRCGTIGV